MAVYQARNLNVQPNLLSSSKQCIAAGFLRLNMQNKTQLSMLIWRSITALVTL
jgi:hypothetical protein